jgi:hypothetical protein
MQVFVKVSGKTSIADNPDLKSHLSKSTALMQEYGYTSNSTNTQMPYLLTVRYNTEGVNQLLRNANVPIWGVDRPLILAWVDIEVPNKPAEIIDAGSETDIPNALKQRAMQRGLPMLLPMMDVTDLNLVSVNDIATMTAPNLVSAAKRYASDAILIARVFPTATGFSVQAKLLLGTDSWDWNLSENNLTRLMENLVDNMTDTLALRYSSVTTNTTQTHLTVKITGVTQQNDFADLMRYVQHMTSVISAEPMKISGDNVVLSINLHGTNDAFVKAISLDKKLTPVADGTDGTILVYQWNH